MKISIQPAHLSFKSQSTNTNSDTSLQKDKLDAFASNMLTLHGLNEEYYKNRTMDCPRMNVRIQSRFNDLVIKQLKLMGSNFFSKND